VTELSITYMRLLEDGRESLEATTSS